MEGMMNRNTVPGLPPNPFMRVMASRQYSRKYRLKQEQYIQHLENKVEVSIMSTRLKYMTRKNSLERLENVSLKQKLSALTAQQVELNKENDGLKQLYGQQQQHRYMNYLYWSA
ncbi:hypothetical protein ACOSQ4_004048 [Xanthoceras sorbifolium]